jgi:hypothetical protein
MAAVLPTAGAESTLGEGRWSGMALHPSGSTIGMVDAILFPHPPKFSKDGDDAFDRGVRVIEGVR